MERKIWANSGDSHFLEPADLFDKTLPPALAERMPRSVKSESGDRETVYIDGQVIERPLPRPIKDGEFAGETIETLSARPPGATNNYDYWEPLWAAVEETGLILTIHIGTDGPTVFYRGPGGAVINYVETTYGGQRATAQLIAGGALDRHPELKVLIAEGGAAWAPFLGDRMNEGYRQHGMFVRPKLSLLPKEYIYRQVY